MINLQKIKELCLNKNVTIKQAALDLGMTEQAMHKIIKTNSTKIETLISIAQYFNIEPTYFFDSSSDESKQTVIINREELNNLIKKILAYSIHGFGMVKLEWDNKEQKFKSYFDVLKKQYSPDTEDLKYISSILDKNIKLTDKATPKDITRQLMTKDEFDFTSTYYYSLRKAEVQEELQKLTSFLNRHNIEMTDSIYKEMEDLKEQIRYYESKSIIGNN